MSDYPWHISPAGLHLPPLPFSGYIFDCDGTLVDSMPLHLKAWRAALELQGFAGEQFTLEMHHDYAGMPGPAIVRDLNAKFATNLDPEKAEKDKVTWYMAHHSEVTEVAPVAELARSAHGNIPMAVASGSDRHLVLASLEGLNLVHLFQTIVTPEMVAQGKPAPDMFLLAAANMGIPAEQCLVFEDGHLGMQAAAAAGMTAVWVSGF